MRYIQKPMPGGSTKSGFERLILEVMLRGNDAQVGELCVEGVLELPMKMLALDRFPRLHCRGRVPASPDIKPDFCRFTFIPNLTWIS